MTDRSPGWEAFVLLLIDVQQDFWTEQAAADFPAFPSNVEQLLTGCRSEGIDVVHVRARFEPDGSDWMPAFALQGATPCIRGTAGAEPMPFAREHPGETVVFKQAFDAFESPELRSLLQARGKRFVLTAGLLTGTCVLFTTASAMQRGFLTAVVEDCCADERNAHAHTLEWYNFIFDRTTAAGLASRRSGWLADLNRLRRPGG